MMTYEELYRLKIQPEGQDKVDALKSALKQANDECDAAVNKFGTAGASVKAYTKLIDDLEKALSRASVKAEAKANAEAAAAAKRAAADQLAFEKGAKAAVDKANAEAAASAKAAAADQIRFERGAKLAVEKAKADEAAAARSAAASDKAAMADQIRFERGAKAAVDKANKDAPKSGRSGMSAGGLMQVGYFLDDIQYGIRGVANNIPGLLGAVGVVGKLAGALSIASAAAVLLYNQWDNLMGLFGQGETQTEADRMEELRKKTALTADEAERLKKASRIESAVSGQRSDLTQAEQEQQGGVRDLVTELGREKILKGLGEAERGRIINTDEEAGKAAKEVAKIEAAIRNELVGAVNPVTGQFDRMGRKKTPQEIERDLAANPNLQKAKAELEARVRGGAEKMLGEGEISEDGLRKLITQVERNPGAYPPDLVAGLKQLTPEGKAALGQEDLDYGKQVEANAKRKGLGAKLHQAELDRLDGEDEANQHADDANRDAFRKARAKKFEAARDSGLGPLIADQLAAAMKQGGDISPLKKALQERLTATFGLAAGPAMLKDAETDAKRQVMLDWVNGKDEKHRNSAVMSGGADWARTIQAGVGGGKDREQLQRLDRIAAIMNEQLKVTKEAKAQPPAPGRAFVGK